MGTGARLRAFVRRSVRIGRFARAARSCWVLFAPLPIACVVVASLAGPARGSQVLLARGLRLAPARGQLVGSNVVHGDVCRVGVRMPSSVPTLLAIGASFTAGVGSGHASANWAAQLAERMGWRAVTVGVPGAGFSEAGADGIGPFSNELAIGRRLVEHPKVIIVQGGHDDWRIPGNTERRNVTRLVGRLAKLTWKPTLVFLSVFVTPNEPAAVLRQQQTTDATILAAVRAVDPAAITINPFRWRFARRLGGLHPTASGYATIAQRVAQRLAAAGIGRFGGSSQATNIGAGSLLEPTGPNSTGPNSTGPYTIGHFARDRVQCSRIFSRLLPASS